MKSEPVLAWASIVAFVGAVLVLLRSFGFGITEDQYNAIIGVVVVAGPIVAGVLGRRKVTPVE